EGHARLEQELEQLKRVERPGIIKAIAEARAHGDLSENAEYHAAKERQGVIEGRIRDLEGKLGGAEGIEPPKGGTRLTVGSALPTARNCAIRSSALTRPTPRPDASRSSRPSLGR